MEWGGEHEDSLLARKALAQALPPFVLAMALIVIVLFNCMRIFAIIWLTVPLAIIGIVVGLLIFGQPFGFMALLGALSLMGMLIKNSIVLIDETNAQLSSGKEAWDASDSAVSCASGFGGAPRFGLILLAAGCLRYTTIGRLMFACADPVHRAQLDAMAAVPPGAFDGLTRTTTSMRSNAPGLPAHGP